MADAAIAYADGCRTPHGNDDRRIDRFREDVLIKSERTEEACRRYGLQTATGPTYLSIHRDTAKRYPAKDRRQVLLDLIEARGERGKWFAAAKGEGFLDVAVSCAGLLGRACNPRARRAGCCCQGAEMLSRSKDSGLKPGWSLCSVWSTAAAMIRQSRWSGRLLTICSMPHRGSARGIGP
jgi:hypothetical protein